MTLRELIDDARAVAPPCPALVGLGRDDSGAEIFVDLEAAGVVDLGAHESGLDAARHLTATLAVTPLADELRVVTVGEVLARAGRPPRGAISAGPAELPSRTSEAMTAPIVAATGGHRSTFCLRAIAGHEPWEPVVVILRDPPPPGDPAWDALTALAAAHRGVAVVGAGLPARPGRRRTRGRRHPLGGRVDRTAPRSRRGRGGAPDEVIEVDEETSPDDVMTPTTCPTT